MPPKLGDTPEERATALRELLGAQPDAMGIKLIGKQPSPRRRKQIEANGVNTMLVNRVAQPADEIQPDADGQYPLATAAREAYLRHIDNARQRDILNEIKGSDAATVESKLAEYNRLAQSSRMPLPPEGAVIDNSLQPGNLGETYRRYGFDAPTREQLMQMSNVPGAYGPSPYETPNPTTSARWHAAAPAETQLHEQLHVRQSTTEAPKGISPRGRELFKVYNATRDPHEIHDAAGMDEFGRESDLMRAKVADTAVANLRRKLGL